MRKRQLIKLCLDGRNNRRVTMTQAGDGRTATAVEVLVSFGVVQVYALTTHGHRVVV